MSDPTINFNTSLSSTPTPPAVLTPVDLASSLAPATPVLSGATDDVVNGVLDGPNNTSGMAPYDPGPSAPAIPSLDAAQGIPVLATPTADPNQVSLLQNPNYVPTTPGGAYTVDTSLTATSLGVGPSIAAPPLSSQQIAVTPYDSNAAAVSLDGNLYPTAGATASAPATPTPAPSLTNGGIAILGGRGTTYAINLSTTASKGYCAIEEWTRYFHQDPFAGFSPSPLVTGAANIAAAKNAAAMVPVLFTGCQISQQDVVGRTLCMENIKILYSFGRNFGDVAITGEILLGNFDDASKAQTTVKNFCDFFWTYRVSNYLKPVTVALLKETFLVYLEGLSIGTIDPQTHIMPFMMHGTLLDIARDTATQKINTAGLVLTSTDVSQTKIAKALAQTTAVDTTTLTGVTSSNPVATAPGQVFGPASPSTNPLPTSTGQQMGPSPYATAPINAADPTSPFAITSVSSTPIPALTSLPGKPNPGALGAAYNTFNANSNVNTPASTPETTAFNFTPVTSVLTSDGSAVSLVPGFDPAAVNAAATVTGIPPSLQPVNDGFEAPVTYHPPVTTLNTAPTTTGVALPAVIQPNTQSDNQNAYLINQGLYQNVSGQLVRTP